MTATTKLSPAAADTMTRIIRDFGRIVPAHLTEIDPATRGSLPKGG